MKIIALTAVSVALFLVSCADPAANKPKATTTAPNSNAAPATAQADVLSSFKATGTELVISPDSSKIEFTGSKVTGKHDGGFKEFRGAIDLVGDKAETSRVFFEIDMASVFTDADGLTKHLQDADFFDVAKFPKATFVSTKIALDTKKGGNNFDVSGDLQIRGVKKAVTFPATITVAPDETVVKSEFAINRQDFGIAYAGKADDLIRDDVVLRLDLKAKKK